MKPPPLPIFRAKRTMWRILRRNCHGQKLRLLLPKTAPKSFFQKTRFLSVFTKSPPQLFLGPNGQCEAFRDEIVMDEFTHFCLKRSRNRFSKKHVSGLFLRNPLSPIFRARRTMRHAMRQNCHGQKLRSLLPKPAPKWFFRKTRFRSLFTKPLLTYFRGQNDYMTRFEAKLS
jgi:hypothetical protein